MSDKFITESGLSVVLTKLKNWFPFRKKVHTNGIIETQVGQNNAESSEAVFSVGVGDEGALKNAFEVQKDGDIYILRNNKYVKLQAELDKAGTGGQAPSMYMDGYNDIVIPDLSGDEEKNKYKIKEDDTIKEAIKKLDERGESNVFTADTYYGFPTIGKIGTVYIAVKSGQKYVWNSKDGGYVQFSTDIVNGGNAGDWV